jgi:predicted ribosome quality control (RQC) complex YloA/Tae2 family protein
VIDLTEGYRRTNDKKVQTKSPVQEKSSDSSGFVPLGFFADSTASQKESFSEKSFDSDDVQERKKKLAKRLVDMTDEIEDLSNQIYHLQQRVELLERRIIPDSYD